MPTDVAAVGVGYSAPETFTNCRDASATKEELAFSAVDAALDHAGLGIDDVDATVFTTVDGFEGTNRVERTLTAFGQQHNLPVVSVNTGGTGGGSAFKEAFQLVKSGMYDRVLVYGAPTFDSASEAQQILNTAAPPLFEKPFIAAAHMGAFFGTGYMEEHGATDEDFARVAAKNYDAATENPWAHRRSGYTVDDVLDSPMIVSPLRLLGTCPVSSGASALVLTSVETAHDLRNDFVHVDGVDSISNTFLSGYRTYEGFPKLETVAERVYQKAGIDDPVEELDVAELFNPYIPFEFIEYEALGFCEAGEGPAFLREGAPLEDGAIPVNPSGGVIATNSGICASLTRHCEIVLQLMGEAGDRQIDSPERGLAHSWGGNDGQFHTVAVFSR